MKEIEIGIEIEASAERVWKELTDFDRYAEWNPFIVYADGEVEAGKRLTIKVKNVVGSITTFRPVLLTAEPNRELRWLGRLVMPQLLEGDHVFVIEPIDDNRVRFIQREKFKGLLVPFLTRRLNRDAKWGFEGMNQALKQRLENS